MIIKDISTRWVRQQWRMGVKRTYFDKPLLEKNHIPYMEKGSLLYADNLAPAISQGQAETNELFY